MELPALSLLETRVLGVLIEKQHTVPDSYPLTLNALQSGCNQKTSRDPVIDATEAEIIEAAQRAQAHELTRMVADLQLFAVHAQDTAMRILVSESLQPERPALTPRYAGARR